MARRKCSESIVPVDQKEARLDFGGRELRLTNLQKPFWPKLGITKGDLLRYYESVSHALLPHIRDRAMVMKRYPHGWQGEFFFMKRAPAHRPKWIETCHLRHGRGYIDFVMVQDLPSLLWVINLGCIDLNPWYGVCSDPDRPDHLHFDLDPVPGATFAKIRETALIVRELLEWLGMPVYAKTTGSKGMHLYVPIVRGPTQKQVWTFAKAFALEVERRAPKLATAIYEVARRPRGRVLVDYNQNRLGSTLASVYSVRPRPEPTVSTPVTWEEVESGVETGDFTLHNVPDRVRRLGDLWCPPEDGRRFDLMPLIEPAAKALKGAVR